MGSKRPLSEALAAWLPAQRWFGAKQHRIATIDVLDTVDLGCAALHVIRVVLDDGDVQRYAVPLTPSGVPADALGDPAFVRQLVGLVRDRARVAGRAGAVTGHRARAFVDGLGLEPQVRSVGSEQSNSSVVVGQALILKHFRRLEAGLNPELEITHYLTEQARFPNTPALAGWLEYDVTDVESSTLAVLQEYVGDARDGWEWILAAMGDPERRALSIAEIGRLGGATAGLHLALAAAPATASFLAAERITGADVEQWLAAISAQVAQARRAASADASVPLIGERRIADALAPLEGQAKCRLHGDFHLGQTLFRESARAWTIIDFEGEPLRPLAERRRKHSPLRDVAGMLRSFAYATETVRAHAVATWVDAWERDARAAFLVKYLATAAGAPFLPQDARATLRAVAAFEVEKAAYEVVYEANNRPEWIGIPLRGLVRAVSALSPPAASGAA